MLIYSLAPRGKERVGDRDQRPFPRRRPLTSFFFFFSLSRLPLILFLLAPSFSMCCSSGQFRGCGVGREAGGVDSPFFFLRSFFFLFLLHHRLSPSVSLPFFLCRYDTRGEGWVSGSPLAEIPGQSAGDSVFLPHVLSFPPDALFGTSPFHSRPSWRSSTADRSPAAVTHAGASCPLSVRPLFFISLSVRGSISSPRLLTAPRGGGAGAL